MCFDKSEGHFGVKCVQHYHTSERHYVGCREMNTLRSKGLGKMVEGEDCFSSRFVVRLASSSELVIMPGRAS